MLALISHFSYLAIFALLLACGLGAPLSEELILLATGALVAKGLAHPMPAIAVAFAGVVAGDLALFTLGKHLGGRAMKSKQIKKLCPPARQETLARRFARWGPFAIFGARFVAGVRACTFFGAGMLGVPRKRFVLADALAAAIWVPLVVLLASHLGEFLHGQTAATVRAAVIGLALTAIAALGIKKFLRRPNVAQTPPLEDAER